MNLKLCMVEFVQSSLKNNRRVVFMKDCDLILWVMGAGFAIIFGLFIIVWNALREDIRIHHDEIKAQTLRSDRLYEMWSETLKEIKELHGRVSVLETKK